MSERYRKAGVDLDAADAALARYAGAFAAATRPEVLDAAGGFAGSFRLSGYRAPVLVSCTDGVGSKVKLASELGDLSGLGEDLVAMVLNDLACTGAEPLFFLDYLAVPRLDPEVAGVLVGAIARALADEGCALLGGETAELPGMYLPGAFDIAGFAVGAVEEPERLSPGRVRAGDVLVGVASSGFHANGYSLVRRIAEEKGLRFSQPLAGATLGAALLRPTLRYGNALRAAEGVHAAAHITGGGLPGNVVRLLPEGLGAHISLRSVEEPEVMQLIRKAAAMGRDETLPVFNLGLGLVVAVERARADEVQAAFDGAGHRATIVGDVREGPRKVEVAW